MLIAEARVETERPSRYLVQLCRHFSHNGRHLRHGLGTQPIGDEQAHGDVRVRVEWSEAHGIVNFSPWGQCTMQATPNTLALRAEAPDQESLRRVQDLIAEHLARFGSRDQLKVSWQRLEPPTVQSHAEIPAKVCTVQDKTGSAAGWWWGRRHR